MCRTPAPASARFLAVGGRCIAIRWENAFFHVWATRAQAPRTMHPALIFPEIVSTVAIAPTLRHVCLDNLRQRNLLYFLQFCHFKQF
jgi:hypothetical protein